MYRNNKHTAPWVDSVVAGGSAARAPGRGRGLRLRLRRAAGARHGGELVRGRRVGRALLPRAALHHEPGGGGPARGCARSRVRRRARRLAAQHVAEVAQGRASRPLVSVVGHVLQLNEQKWRLLNWFVRSIELI